MFLFSLFTTISSELRSYFQTLLRWVEAVLTCAIFICPRQQDLAFVLAAFSLITPKSPLCWRQPLLVFVGRLPTTYTQKNTHTHVVTHYFTCQSENTSPMRQWALINVRHQKVKGFTAVLPSFFYSAETSLSETFWTWHVTLCSNHAVVTAI